MINFPLFRVNFFLKVNYISLVWCLIYDRESPHRKPSQICSNRRGMFSNRRRSEVNTYDIAHNCVAEDLDERIFSQDTLLLVNLHLNKENTASITWIGGRIKYLFVF